MRISDWSSDVCSADLLGVIFATGGHGVAADLIEAHKWFNLAAAAGHEEAAWCRADVSDEMTAREIAEDQRRARQWPAEEVRQAAWESPQLAGAPPPCRWAPWSRSPGQAWGGCAIPYTLAL